MYINAEIVMKIKMARIRCEALVNDEIVAQGELTLYYMEDLL